jgi:hypothetical protein
MLNRKKACNKENMIQDVDTIKIKDTKPTTVMQSFHFVKLLTQ